MTAVPEVGALVRLRDRHCVVTDVVRSTQPLDLYADSDLEAQDIVFASSVEDDGFGDELTVVWQIEPGAEVLPKATLPPLTAERLDDPSRLDAFLDAIRWGAVASADTRALQAPFRSGIQIADYQLEPVVRALEMPRVNLLIADEVGIGKTIEAGLVVQELLLRHRARTVLVVCPADLQQKWHDEMLDRFGLEFFIADSASMRELRRTVGPTAPLFGTYPRMIVSLQWLRRPEVLRQLTRLLPANPVLERRRFDLLIVDEAHHAAPAGKGKWAKPTLNTQTIREIAPHFEHRLFLSATPHNGYRESFWALLEMLDPQRFSRMLEPSKESLRRGMVLRTKRQLRTEPGEEGFDPLRNFARPDIVALPVRYTDEEREAHRRLETYTSLRKRRIHRGEQNIASDFISLVLKARLFSSPAAFLDTLEQHLRTLSGVSGQSVTGERALRQLFDEAGEALANDEDADELTAEALDTAARTVGQPTPEELAELDELQKWAKRAAGRPDSKYETLYRFLEETCFPGGQTEEWTDERVIVFTQYTRTLEWLHTHLLAAGIPGDRMDRIYGGMDEGKRERLKRVFQAHPDRDPIRILLATDAASEGIDLQNHCHRIVHLEIPFSPTKLAQRNGRVDRFGQPSPVVLIHHFVGEGFEEAAPGSLEGDLEFLVRMARKRMAIQDDIGVASELLAKQVEEAMLGRSARLEDVPDDVALGARAELQKIERDLREQRERLMQLKDRVVETADELGISPDRVARVVNEALRIAHQPQLQPGEELGTWEVPDLTHGWALATRDLIDRMDGSRRPITFDHRQALHRDDLVLVHLNHPLADRAMRMLRKQIWATGPDVDLARVSARFAPRIDEPSIVAVARLVLAASDGTRLHEEVIAAGGRIRDGRFRRWDTLAEVKAALEAAGPNPVPAHLVIPFAELWPSIERQVFASLEVRGDERATSLASKLKAQAEEDEQAVVAVLGELERSIRERLGQVQLTLPIDDPDRDDVEAFERDREALERRLDALPEEVETERRRVRARYTDPEPHLFPAAVMLLLPEGTT
jgi:superfamily II DNA or RNA helicase